MLNIQRPYTVKELQWDREYFGVSSCRVDLNREINQKDFMTMMQEVKDYHFVSLNNHGNQAYNNYLIGSNTNAFLVDTNIQFIKTVTEKQSVDDSLNLKFTVQNRQHKNEIILKISKNAFVISKFTNDPFLKEKKGNLVYYHWVKNAFEKDDKYFLKVEFNKKIYGFILFRIEEKSTVIELIAVDKQQKGKYIGKSMLIYLENYLKQLSIVTLKVGTQLDNLDAVNFYNHCGFKVVERTAVFHWWI